MLWSDIGSFSPNKTTIENLEFISQNVDAAIFIFAKDDKTWYNEKVNYVVRDNVLFEYGLFTGHLSRCNVCICVKEELPKLATDILTITYIDISSNHKAKIELSHWINSIYTIKMKKFDEETKVVKEKLEFHYLRDKAFYSSIIDEAIELIYRIWLHEYDFCYESVQRAIGESYNISVSINTLIVWDIQRIIMLKNLIKAMLTNKDIDLKDKFQVMKFNQYKDISDSADYLKWGYNMIATNEEVMEHMNYQINLISKKMQRNLLK